MGDPGSEIGRRWGHELCSAEQFFGTQTLCLPTYLPTVCTSYYTFSSTSKFPAKYLKER